MDDRNPGLIRPPARSQAAGSGSRVCQPLHGWWRPRRDQSALEDAGPCRSRPVEARERAMLHTTLLAKPTRARTMGLQETLQRLEQATLEKSADKPVMLPTWPSSKRACPSLAFRSALFPALRRGQRRWLKDETIFAVGSLTVTFRGEQLDQEGDLSVYLELLHHFNGQQSDHAIEITAYSLLQSLGRKKGGSDYEWLDQSLKRLTAGLIEIQAETRSKTYRGHLIDWTDEDRSSGKYQLGLNPSFARIFAKEWSSLDIVQRRKLKGATAKSLHSYLSSHHEPGPHRFETLACIAGLSGKNARSTIRTALGQLQSVGFLSSWSENEGKVSFLLTVDNLSG